MEHKNSHLKFEEKEFQSLEEKNFVSNYYKVSPINLAHCVNFVLATVHIHSEVVPYSENDILSVLSDSE